MSAVAGFFLFGIAALFSISLLLVLGDLAGANPARGTGLYRMGKMFASVYGLCSVLIPVFLVIAAVQCFSDTWTTRRGVLLVGSFLPFFTLDALEHALRMLIAGDSGAVLGIKVSAALLTGALIIAAEVLILLLISDVIESALMKEKQKESDGYEDDYDGIDVIETDGDAIEDEFFDDEVSESEIAPASTDAASATTFALSTEKPSETLADGTANPFVNFFGSPLPEPKVQEPVEPVESAVSEPAEPELTIEQAELSAQADEPYQPVPPAQPIVHEVPHYNENAAPLASSEEDEPSEVLELNSFDPEKDSYDGFVPHEEEAAEMEAVDDDIAAFENQNANDFDADFYDIDLNADDDETDADLDAEIDDYEQRLEREELELTQATDDEIAPEEQKSTSLDSIFADMDDDAAHDPQGVEPVIEEPAIEEPVIAEETAIDFAEDGIFDDSAENLDSSELADEGEDFTEPAVTPEEESFDEPEFADEQEFADDVAFEEPVAFDDETVIDETVIDDIEEPSVPEDFGDVPVVDPLAPPVVDANGMPYETAVDEAEVKEAAAAVSASQTVRPAMSVTVTAAAPAEPPVAEVRPRRRTYATYNIPTEGILDTYPDNGFQIVDEATKRAGEELKATLGDFKIEAEVTGIRKGPVVTMFEILPAPGVKLSKIVALQDNIALRLAASSVRIVAPIPGKHAVGIEVPNKARAIVGFKEIIEQDLPQFKKMAIPVVLGKDISGEAQLIDLAKTPHLLIAGSTGAGKSVCVNTMILSILYKRSPDQVKLIMIDPKVVELKLYNDIPHLLTPVITEPKKAFQSLQYCLCEMERRYALLDGMGVRDIVSYNNRIVERHIATEKLPYIVVIIDEFADLMATTGKELEQTIARLAAMSRAVGIHLVLATQRPSVDVITGLIKANIPSRIAFMVASKMDSRIIIDQVGAEKLLGKGDMLYASATDPFPVRIQGTLVNDNEVERVVNCVKSYGEPEYIDDEIFVDDEDEGANPGLFSEGDDPLYDEALEIVMQAGKASASYIQRRLKIGYNRAARLVEEMEERGIVGPANGSKPREVIHMV